MAARLPPALRSLPPLRRPPISSSTRSPSAAAPLRPVGIFWDLDNKPPESMSTPAAAAARLRLAASSLGPISLSLAYTTSRFLRRSPPPVAAVPRRCGVCGRNFYNLAKLVNHFKQIHEQEHLKRLRRLDSSRGGLRARLAGKFSVKMVKYERAARDLVAPEGLHGVFEELRRGGFQLREVAAMGADVADAIAGGRIGCLVLVSDDAELAGVVREARVRRLKTVVIGGRAGALRRAADAGFSWEEVSSGKVRKETVLAAGRWRDQELLRRLEWTHCPPEEAPESGDSDLGSEEEGEEEDDEEGNERIGWPEKSKPRRPWWELEPGPDDSKVLRRAAATSELRALLDEHRERF